MVLEEMEWNKFERWKWKGKKDIQKLILVYI
jgi:hypothetical protein